MSSERRLVILGDSHASSLLRGFKRKPEAFAGIEIESIAAGRIVREFTLDLASGETILNPLIPQALVSHRVLSPNLSYADRNAHVLFLFGSNHHNITSTNAFHGFSVQGVESGQEGAPLGNLPVELLDDFMEDRLERVFQGLGFAKTLLEGNVSLLLGPPIQRHQEVYANAIRPVPGPLAAEAVRLEIYQAGLRALRRGAARIGIPVVDPNPEDAVVDGFLNPRFSRDGTHANPDYAELALGVIAAAVNGGSTQLTP